MKSAIILLSFLISVSAWAAYGDTTTWVSKIYWGDGQDKMEAYLDFPEDAAVDNNGNFYIADTYNNALRKIDTSGQVSTVYGSGAYGDGDNELAMPKGVAVDAEGNVYVADTANDKIKKIKNNQSTTLAANLNGPEGVEIKDNTVYFLDTGNNALKKVSKNGGTVRTITSQLNAPKKLEIIGNYAYVANSGSYQVVRVNLDSGDLEVIAGTGKAGYKEGDCQQAKFQNLWGISSDGADKLFLADGDGTTDFLRQIDLASCTVSLLASDMNMVSINYPAGLAYQDGNVYVANAGIGTIHRFNVNDPNDNEIYAGKERFQNDNARHLLGRPVEMIKNGDWIYFIENNKIKKINIKTKKLRLVAGHSVDNYAEGKAGKARFSSPPSLDVTKDGQYAYVADRWNHRIRGINLKTKTTFYITGAGMTRGTGNQDNGYAEGNACLNQFEQDVEGCAYFNQPAGLVLSKNEKYLYVADAGNGKIRKVTISTGKTKLLINHQFTTPWSLALNKKSNILFIADRDAHTIYQYNLKTKKLKTLVGNGSAGYADGKFSSARFSLPNNLKYHQNKLYLSEVGGQRVRLLDLKLKVTKLISGSGNVGFENGPAGTAEFNGPMGLVVTKNKLYLADNRNDQIRVIKIKGQAPYTDPAPSVVAVSPTHLRKSDYPEGYVMIAVTGANFRYGAETYFGSVKAIKTYVQSSTSLAVKVPLSDLTVGTYDVKVVNSDNQFDILKNAFHLE